MTEQPHSPPHSPPPMSSQPSTPPRPNGKGPPRDEPKDEFDPAFDPFKTREERRLGWLQKRRAKTVAEISRNRRGEYAVPTWVLGGILVVVVGACAAIVFFG